MDLLPWRRYLRQALLLSGLLLLCGAACAAPQRYRFDLVHSQLQFYCSHVGFSQSEGEFHRWEGELRFDKQYWANSSVDLTIDVSSIDMDDEAWNAAMLARSYFNFKKFPQMRFRSLSVQQLDAQRGYIDGELTLLGVTRPLRVDFQLNKHGIHPLTLKETLGFSGHASLKRADFGMSASPRSVGDLVQIRLELEATRIRESAVHAVAAAMSTNTERAALSLRSLLYDPAIPESVRQLMVAEFAELERALGKLERDEIHVAVFGRVSVGKSALLNALLGRPQFGVGVLHGTTKSADQRAWSEASVNGIHLIDTPGIDELDGESRERLAYVAAQRVDLILFVIEGDITDTELSALRNLIQPQRPILLVLNKMDRYSESERKALLEQVALRVAGLVPRENLLPASALPSARLVVRVDAQGVESESWEPQKPQIAVLQARITELLAANGKTMAALNAGLLAGAVSDQLGLRLIEARREVASKLLATYSLTKGVAVGLNPIPVADLLAAAGLDIALVVHLSHVYGLPLTKVEAGQLIGTIVAQLAALMGAIWGVHLVASALKGLSIGLSTALTAGAQGALAYYATLLTGRAAERYLENGKSWGEHGPKRVVKEILDGLDRDSILRQAREEIFARLKR